MKIFRRTYAEVNLQALRANYHELKKNLSEDQFFCPMVKANAYGHGDVRVAQVLEELGVEHLGVCLIEEGLLLRAAGIKSNILVFRGFDREGAQEMLRSHLTPVVSTWDQLEILSRIISMPIRLHLKFDTGMNRLGFGKDEAQKVFEHVQQYKHLKVEGVLTHLLKGEDYFDPQGYTQAQIEKFLYIEKVFESLKPTFHVFNSAGFYHSMMQKKSRVSLSPAKKWGIRPGLILYGVHPQDQPEKICQPVLSFRSHLNSTRKIKKGETVSYGAQWKAARDSIIGVVPVGYADGYLRAYSNKAKVLIHQHYAPVIGVVCMDYMMIDLTDVSQVHRIEKDDEITLFGYDRVGNEVSCLELAQHAHTIPWEVLTSLSERVPRIYTEGASCSTI